VNSLDWPFILRNTMRPLLSAAIALVALVVVMWMHSEQQQQLSSYSASYRTVRNDFDQLIAEQRMVERYQRRYDRFKESGFVGPESRLDWIETLRTTTEALALPRVSYSIEPQLEVDPPVKSGRNSNDMQIRVSRAQLQLGLNHEGDLLRFFDELQQQAPGLIKVDECDLSWQADMSVGLVAGNNLAASCSLQIYSVITSEYSSEDL